MPLIQRFSKSSVHEFCQELVFFCTQEQCTRPYSASRGPYELQQDRQMVGDTAGVAGAGVGAERLFSGVDRITGEEKRNAEDAHSRG